MPVIIPGVGHKWPVFGCVATQLDHRQRNNQVGFYTLRVGLSIIAAYG